MRTSMFLIISCVAFLFTSCKEDDPVLCPGDLPCFAEGKSDFIACYMNGEPWEAAGVNFNYAGPMNGVYLAEEKRFWLLGARHEDNFTFEFSFEDVKKEPGVYRNVATDRQRLWAFDSACEVDGFDYEYIIDTEFDNYLELVQFGPLEGQYRGHFQMQYIHPLCGNKFTMTSGVFNIGFTGR